MNIWLVSDLHGEFDQEAPSPPQNIDLIVLAGDIDHSTMSLRTAQWYQKETNVPAIIVAGNHEFYRGDFHRTLSEMRADAAELEHVHFLENDCIVIKGIRFLGATLWANYKLYGESRVVSSRRSAGQYINDFRAIRNGNRTLRAEDIIPRFEESYAWLEQELAKPFAGKTVVVTHFAPHPAAIHPRFTVADADLLTPYFTPDCSELIRRFNIDAWMFGHTHNSVDTIVEGKTRLVSNQRGYPREDPEYVDFGSSKIIVL